MSCYQCSKKFGLFNKEVGCGNCGFGFCSKCCSFKIAVPKKDNKVMNVCFKCNDSITKNKTATDEQDKRAIYSPPKNFLKLVESNRAKNLPEPAEDKEIIQRLQKLQKETPPAKVIPSEQELESRLNKLQSNHTETKNKPTSNLPTEDTEQQPEDVIKKIMDEVRIEKDFGDFERQEIEKLEKRLENLKSNNKPTENEARSSSDLPGAISTENPNELKPVPREIDPSEELMKKFLQDAEISYKKKAQEEEEIDTWCCLCNDDAILKCHDCGDDLFCNRCYKQTHSKGDYKNHRKTIRNINK